MSDAEHGVLPKFASLWIAHHVNRFEVQAARWSLAHVVSRRFPVSQTSARKTAHRTANGAPQALAKRTRDDTLVHARRAAHRARTSRASRYSHGPTSVGGRRTEPKKFRRHCETHSRKTTIFPLPLNPLFQVGFLLSSCVLQPLYRQSLHSSTPVLHQQPRN